MTDNTMVKRRMTDNTMAKRKSIKEKDKQRSTKHIYINKDRVTRTQLKTGGDSVLRKCRQFLWHSSC